MEKKQKPAERLETENRLPMPKGCQIHPVDKLPEAAQPLTPNPRIVILDFTLEENRHLYEPWLKYGRRHRRGPGDQAMMAIDQILSDEGQVQAGESE